MESPKWAESLLLNALIYAKAKNLPDLIWKHRHFEDSSGLFYPAGISKASRIIIHAGYNKLDTKLVLLHEIAHYLTPGTHHRPQFWGTAWDLYRHFRLPIRYCKDREKGYRKGAMVAYKRGLRRNKKQLL